MHVLGGFGSVGWKVRAIRGATTARENTVEAMTIAVQELLDAIEERNQLNPEEIVSVTFSVTQDLDAIFPAAIARQRPLWENVPLLDVQQMNVQGSLERCIRVLIYVNTLHPQQEMLHVYLRNARHLRPEWSFSR
ncbi:MAG: chorismate mutase [Jaaginema sp. PMC 1079.18]|nr:chorismate mutase [Jaaginema sp. PMC 1080.18]MEC4852479.1 chorismate mutase [Jaaginema sp. PMC 1079.18]MEC4868634.1 chorismate mutase [Jaaginema sp. PMC 1078.18]